MEWLGHAIIFVGWKCCSQFIGTMEGVSSGISSRYTFRIAFSRASRSFPPSKEKETPGLLLPNLTRTTFLSTIFLKLLVNSTHSFSTRDQFKACTRCQLPLYSGMIFVNIPCPRGEIVVKSPSITPACTGVGGWGVSLISALVLTYFTRR